MTRAKSFFTYAGVILATFLVIFFTFQINNSFIDPSLPFSPLPKIAEPNHVLVQLLLALVSILVFTRIFGFFAKYIGQPTVIGEVIGGICLGPSLLGFFFPQIQAGIFPTEVIPYISLIAQLGIIFYMFVVGLEFDLGTLKNNAHSTLLISHVSIIFPLLLGIFLGIFIYPHSAPTGVNPTHFALFMGISLSITAFPVLARILSDKKLEQTKIGRMSLACAAIDDVSAWCLLALCLSLMQENLAMGLRTFAGTLLYLLLALFVMKPLLSKWIGKLEQQDELSNNALGFFFIALFVSALATEWIGIHAIFGAFLLGVIVPHQSKVKVELTRHTENLSKLVFLPAFFVFTGLRTQISLLESSSDLLLCLVIIVLAVLGKFGGATLAAKYSGFSWRESSAIGILMNTRGLVELVVLNIGLDMKVITPRLFTMLVIMALVTTFITSPLLILIRSRNGTVTGDHF